MREMREDREAPNPTLELEAAFEAFTRMSDVLDTSYRTLQGRVTELTHQLTEARSERLLYLAEKEQLANRLSALVSVLPGGVVVVDERGEVIEANTEAQNLFGSDVIGQNWHARVHERAKAVGRDGSDLTLTDGKRVTVAARRLADESGSEVLLVADVTRSHEHSDWQHRESRLVALGDLSARVAHQIRTPVSSALLYLDQLKSPILEQSARVRVCEKVGSRLMHIEELIDSMLAFVGGGDRALTRFSVADLVEELRATLMPALAAKCGALLTLSTIPPDLQVTGCRHDLLSVLIAVAENAIRLIEMPAIALRVESNKDHIDIFVSDNGPGVSEEIADRMFDPFFSTRANGTGLGLAIASVTAREHGGDLSVAANEYGGATFRLRLARGGEPVPPVH